MPSFPQALSSGLRVIWKRVAPALLLMWQPGIALAADIDTVEARLKAQLIAAAPSATTVQGYEDTLQAAGSWADIVYTSTAQTNWPPQTHLARLLAMAEAYQKSGHPLHQDASLKAAILKAYDYWVYRSPYCTSTNWWYNLIGGPQALGNIMVLMKADLTSAQKTKGLSFLSLFGSDPTAYTGLNCVDIAIVRISRGIVAEDSAIVASAFSAIGGVIEVTTDEGIQIDGSFHQHGPQLYNQGYGSGYISAVLSWSVMAAGTSYQITAAQHKILVDYILDGSQQMIRGEALDYTASGRGISRTGQSTTGNGLISPATNARLLGTYRDAELQTLVTRQTNSRTNGTASVTLALTGHKHFWRGDLSVHHRPDYYTSVKVSSSRTYQPESGNGEGLKNLYLADGVTQIMRTGNEYDDIMPVWDWRRLPGTTVEQNTVTLKPSTDWGMAGTTGYAGGVSEGGYGATAFNYSRAKVAAKKGWFHFDDEFAALGAAVNAPTSTSPVYTTLNQCLLNGAVTYSNGTIQTLSTGAVTPPGLKWVHHDGIGYFFPTPVSNATIQAAAQSGTWSSLNTGGSTGTVTKNVFSLYVSQPAGASGGSYNYVVVPGISAAGMDAWLAANPVLTLRNDATAQAVRNTASDVTQAAFYAAGSVTLATGQTLAVNDKAVVQVRRGPDVLRVAAASPEARTMSLQTTTSGVLLSGQAVPTWFDSFGTAVSTVSLPGGDLAGSSVGYTLSNSAGASPVVKLENTLGSSAITYTVGATAAASVLAGTTTFETTADTTLALNHPLNGVYGIAKTGAGTLALAGPNGYAGTTVASAGVLNVSGNQSAATGGWNIGNDQDGIPVTVSFLSSSSVVIDGGRTFRINQGSSGGAAATLNVAGTVTNHGSLEFARGTIANLNSGTNWIQNGGMSIGPGSGTGYATSLVVNSGAAFTYAGNTGMVVKPSAGASGTTTLTVAGGTFTTSRGFHNPVAASTGSANLVLQGGGILKLSSDVAALVTTAGSAFNFKLGSGGGSLHTNGFTTNLAAPVSGTGALVKTGGGTLTLSGPNSFTGGLTVNANGGTLVATSPAALGTGTISIPKGGSQTGTLAFAFTGTNTVANTFGGFNSTTFAGETTPPCIENLSGDTTITAPLTITGTGGNGLFVRASGGFITLAGNVTQTVGTIRSFGLAGAGDGKVSGNILTATGGLTLDKYGTGTWTLTGTNTYASGTSIDAGTLRIGDGGTTGTLGGGSVTNGGTLEIKRSDSWTLSNAISGSGRLVHSGTGATTLSGANSYSGGTRVESGTLILPSARLADAAAVEISEGAVLHLAFSGSDTVGNLTLGDELQFAGTWGAIGSGADHETDRITGSGLLLVATGLDPLLAWLNAFPALSAGDKEMLGDPDQDGVPNLLEYAMGTDPSLAGTLPAARPDGGVLKWRYPVNPEATGVLMEVEWSENLSAWRTDGITTTAIVEEGATRWREVSIAVGAAPAGYVRLRASRP